MSSNRVQGSSLFTYICQWDHYSESVVLQYMRQLVSALLWLHQRNIAHLDLKPENILVNSGSRTPSAQLPTPQHKGLLKLIDFGESIRSKNRDVVLPPSNLEFAAPEQVLGQPLTTSTDSWCFGIIFYILLSGVSPFLDDSIEETTANILKCDFSFPEEYFHDISNDAKNLLTRVLVLQGIGRASMEECQSSSWFTQVILHFLFLSIKLIEGTSFERIISFVFVFVITGIIKTSDIINKIRVFQSKTNAKFVTTKFVRAQNPSA